MTTAKELSDQISKAMEGVTRGPWTGSQNAYGAVFLHGGETLTSSVGIEYKELIAGGNSHNTLTVENGAYIALCNPDNMRVILSALEDAERERDELRAAKWKQQHVDTMNDMASMGLAMESADSRIADLEQQIANIKASRDLQVTIAADEEERARKAEDKLAEAVKVMEPFDNIAKLAGFRGVQDGEIVSVSIDFCRAARSFLASMKGGE